MRLTALLASAVAIGGCDTPSESCPEPLPLDVFVTGEYASPGNNDPATFWPHFGAEGLTMSLDADAGTVEIRFMRKGKAVVERWRMTRRFDYVE